MIAQVSLPPIEDDPRFADAIALFNSGDYFEASDIFEELFFEAVRDEVPVARALLQASVGLLHAERGQKQSAIGRLEEAIIAIDAVTNARGVEFARLRESIRDVIRILSAGRGVGAPPRIMVFRAASPPSSPAGREG